MAKLVIDNWLQGLAPKNWISPTTFGNRLGKPGMILSGEINPFYLPGFLIGGNSTYQAVTNESTIADDGVLRKIIQSDDVLIDSTGALYGIKDGAAAHFHALTSGGVLQTSGSTPKWPKITNLTSGQHNGHTVVVYDDIFRYQVNGVYKTMVLMRDDTDWDILKWDSGLTAGDVLGNVASGATGYSTSMLSIAYPGFCIPSENGFLYIVNKSSVHKFDGTTTGGAGGTLTGNVLTVPDSRMIVDGIDHQGKIWFLVEPATVKTTVGVSDTTQKYPVWPSRDVSVIIWDRDSTLITTENTIKVDGLTEAFYLKVINGVVHLFGRGGGPSSSGTRGVTKIYAYNGSKFVPVKEIGDQDGGGPATRGSMTYYQNGLLWQDIDTVLWWYGNILTEGEAPIGQLFKIGKSTGSITGTGSGAVFQSGPGIIVARLESSVSKLGFFNSLDSTSSGNPSAIYLAPIELPKLSTVNGITIVFYAEANASTSTVQIDIYNKHNATPVSKLIDLDVDIPRGYVYFPLALEKTNMIGIKIAAQSSLTLATMPKIMRIEIDYTPTPRLK